MCHRQQEEEEEEETTMSASSDQPLASGDGPVSETKDLCYEMKLKYIDLKEEDPALQRYEIVVMLNFQTEENLSVYASTSFMDIDAQVETFLPPHCRLLSIYQHRRELQRRVTLATAQSISNHYACLPIRLPLYHHQQ